MPGTETAAARNAVAVVFFLNGLAMATWAGRIPDAADQLSLEPRALGFLLLALSVGAALGLFVSRRVVERLTVAGTVGWAAVVDAVGLAVAGMGADLTTGVAACAAGLFLLGVGSGLWDVAMNVEAAEVERRVRRAIMSRFHAGFSLGTVVGAGLAVLAVLLDIPVWAHLVVVALVVGSVPRLAVRRFLPARQEHTGHGRSAWREPRTLVIGLVVLALALTEGVANDWLGLALIEGHDAARWVGPAGFAGFVASMTLARVLGTPAIDRWGRILVLRTTILASMAGVALVVLTEQPLLVALGIVLWGTGAALGFPIGMSAAADESGRAVARVSVVSTIGYLAFLAGPPVVGFLAAEFGVLKALLVVSVVLLPSLVSARAVVPRPAPYQR